MEWWQTLVVALCTYGFTKFVDHLIYISKEKREFKKTRRERMLTEIEELKDEVGRYFELASNWKSYEMKADKYKKMMLDDDHVIGKYNKYPDIVNAARDALHWCKIVSDDEKKRRDSLAGNKKELVNKYSAFIKICDKQLDNAV
jgi:hypothetical protein